MPMARSAEWQGFAHAYQRRQPEQTRLYYIVEHHYPKFIAHLVEQGRSLPAYIEQEFEDYLKCGRLEHGFLRVRCEHCHHERLVAFSCKRRGFCPSCGARRMADSAALLVDEILPTQPMRQWVLSFPFQLRFLLARYPVLMSRVLGIVYRTLAASLIKKAGHTHRTAKTGAVTLIQRFGSALNLNIHFHMLFLDGVFTQNQTGQMSFVRSKAPTLDELNKLVHTISHRIARYLERQGLLVRDMENTYLQLDTPDDDPLQNLQGHSISYRIAMGLQQGRKVFTLQTVPAQPEKQRTSDRVAKQAGFSLHAGVCAEVHQRDKLERLCRYITRPAVSEQRIAFTPSGHIRYELKTPYRDGTTHIIFDPLDFIARLVSLVPPPRVNLTRYHGVFAPNSHDRARVTPARRGKGNKKQTHCDEVDDRTPAERRAAMTWAQRLKRVFQIDIETCSQCCGPVKVIASIEDPVVIQKILAHLKKKDEPQEAVQRPDARAPPQGRLFD